MLSVTGRAVFALLSSALLAAGQTPPQLTIDHMDTSSVPISAYFRLTKADSAGLTVQTFLDGRKIPESAQPFAKAGVAVKFGGAPAARSVLLVVDISGSVASAWQNSRSAAHRVLERLPHDWPVALMTIGNEVRRVTPVTTDREAVATALDGLAAKDARTVLYDALQQVLQPGGPVVILITDGIDDGSAARAGEVIHRTAAAQCPVVAVDVSSTPGAGSRFLQRLASESGGQYFTAQQTQDSQWAPSAIQGGTGISGVAALADPALQNPDFHELKLVLMDSKTGTRLSESSQVFYSKGRTVSGGVGAGTTLLLLCCLLAILAVLFLLARGRRDPHEAPKPPQKPVEVAPAQAPRLRDLREKVKTLKEQAGSLETDFVDYGNPLEQKAERWRAACHETARRAVAGMRSCWLMREEKPEFDAIYNEMLMNLGVLGLTQIVPRVGEPVNEDDRRYVISERRGAPPYKVARVVRPGFSFSPRMPWQKESGDDVQLEPAELEVEGNR